MTRDREATTLSDSDISRLAGERLVKHGLAIASALEAGTSYNRANLVALMELFGRSISAHLSRAAEPVACIDARHLELLRKGWDTCNCLKHPDDAGDGDTLLYTHPSEDARDVLGEIIAERNRQDAQWGGADHDDDHSPEDWIRFIGAQAVKCAYGKGPDYRERLVKIAALAVAAVETYDRQLRDYGSPDAAMAKENGNAT